MRISSALFANAIFTFRFVCVSDEVNESALAVNWPIVVVCPSMVRACSETVAFKPSAVCSTVDALSKALWPTRCASVTFAVRLSLVCLSSDFVL